MVLSISTNFMRGDYCNLYSSESKTKKLDNLNLGLKNETH